MRIKKVSKESMNEIVKAFSEYQYEDNEEGLYYLCNGKKGIEDYMKGFALAGIKSGWLYTISEKEEGYIMISEPISKVSLLGVIDLIVGCIKGMGFKGAIQFFRDMKSSGESLETKLKNENKKFIQIEMLVIKRKYQNKGYMRKLVQIAFDRADELGVPCIVSTDGILKMKKYEHIGFEHYQDRKFKEKVYEHDLIRYPQKILVNLEDKEI